MKLIAKKPCSFGGEKFYIGDEIPEGMVAAPAVQEKRGILTIIKENEVEVDLGDVSGKEGLFTREAVEVLIAEAVAAVEREKEAQLAELQQHAVEIDRDGLAPQDGTVQIAVVGSGDVGNGQVTLIQASVEEIQQVFSIMQLNADKGARAIADVTSDNVLVLLHAADSRKAIKNAAKEQADKLSLKGAKEEPGGGNEAAGTHTEGS